jgi:hypothetical protein
MLDELLGINPTTVVVMKGSNPVLMPWINKAPAVLETRDSPPSDSSASRKVLVQPGQSTLTVG